MPVCAECGPHLSLSTAQVHKQSSHCNDKKTLSKRVQELSSDLYFGVFVKVGRLEPGGVHLSIRSVQPHIEICWMESR